MSKDHNKSEQDRQSATRFIHDGRRPEWTGIADHPAAVVSPPVWRASTHLYPNCESLFSKQGRATKDEFFYGRRGSPTQWALAEAITNLEGGHDSFLYPSGVAAITTAFLSFLKPGDVVLITDSAYDPVRSFADGFLKRMNIEARYYDPTMGADITDFICRNTKMIWMESPGSLTFEVQDIPAIVAAAKAANSDIVTIIDNTWATGHFFPAIKLGVDISLLACTKYIVGHSDVMMGSLTANEKCWKAILRTSRTLGAVVSPDDAWLALRGLRTMAVRLKQHEASALELAIWLNEQPQIAHVLHPALPNCPGHDIWKRDFSGSSGLFSIVFKGGNDKARSAFVDSLDLFGIGYSWGGFESLALPTNPQHNRSATPWPPEKHDPQDHLVVRLQIGLEDVGDLKNDLAKGLAAWDAALPG